MAIEFNKYGALYDDFMLLDRNTLNMIIGQIELVCKKESVLENIHGSICYKIIVESKESKIYCYDEFIGSEPTDSIYEWLFNKRTYEERGIGG